MTSTPGRGPISIGSFAVLFVLLCVAAAFLVVARQPARIAGGKFQCLNNLRQIYASALQYSNKPAANRAYPIAAGLEPRAHESLNLLVRFAELPSKIFKCPHGDALPAEPDAQGSYELREDTLDYAWTARALLNTVTSDAPLASDKYVEGYADEASAEPHRGHKDGMNVLYTDGFVSWTRREDLPASTGLPPGLAR